MEIIYIILIFTASFIIIGALLTKKDDYTCPECGQHDGLWHASKRCYKIKENINNGRRF